MWRFFIVNLLILSFFVLRCTAPPVVAKTTLEEKSKHEIHDNEYHRYLAEIIHELQQDPEFKKKVHNLTEEDIKAGKILQHVDLLDLDVRRKLDEVKRREIDFQHKLISDKRLVMNKEKRNAWSPIHHENKDTFEQDDLKKLISKHHKLQEEMDKERRKQFKDFLMDKEHKRRVQMKNMTAKEKAEFIKQYNETHHKKHERVHAPGHKAQLMEAWEKEDHLDPEAFDEKTMFQLHDKDGDGYLDEYEMETLFLNELDKLYNESDPETETEREEELQRMREDMVKEYDIDLDGMISEDEFLNEKTDPDYEKDEEWNPIDEDIEFTEEEILKYEDELPDPEHHEEVKSDDPKKQHHEPPHEQPNNGHHEPPHEQPNNGHHEPPHEQPINGHHEQKHEQQKTS